MSTSGKNVVDTGDRDISKFVDIYPISPKLLDEMGHVSKGLMAFQT
ncbi:hypothetical protein NA900_04770 [Escherichia coli]|nr:hypothetical protein [Escherichia coli]